MLCFRLILLNKLLEDGNSLYRAGQLEEASHCYCYALKRLSTGRYCSIDLGPAFSQLELNFLLNLSRCERKRGGEQEAVLLANKVCEPGINQYISCIVLRFCPSTQTVWKVW